MSGIEDYVHNNRVLALSIEREKEEFLIKQTAALLGFNNETVHDELINLLLNKTIPLKSRKEKSAPKGKLNGYQIFAAEKREEVKGKLEDKSTEKVFSELGRLWSTLTSEQQEVYKKLAEEDSLRYDKEKEEYKNKKFEFVTSFAEHARLLESSSGSSVPPNEEMKMKKTPSKRKGEAVIPPVNAETTTTTTTTVAKTKGKKTSPKEELNAS